MATTVNQNFIKKLQRFPTVNNGNIDLRQFLEASADLVTLVGMY